MPNVIPDKLKHYTINKDGCWLWRGSTRTGGYGQIRLGNRKIIAAHIYFYEQLKTSVPAGKVLDHLCKNRLCVNPDHMDIVTQAVNVQRGAQARFNTEIVKEIRQSYKQGKTMRCLARMYKTSSSNICAIVNNATWKED